MTEDQQRFENIINEIDCLMDEAINLIPENMLEKAKSYWYAHIMCAISDDHEFLSRSMHHMRDSLDEWIEQEEDVINSNGCSNCNDNCGFCNE